MQRVLSPDPHTHVPEGEVATAAGVDPASVNASPTPLQLQQPQQRRVSHTHTHNPHSAHRHSASHTETAAPLGSWGDGTPTGNPIGVGTTMPLQCENVGGGSGGSKEEAPWSWSCSSVGAYCSSTFAYFRNRMSPRRIRRDWRPAHTHTAVQVAYACATLLLFVLLYYFNGFAASTSLGPPQDLTCHMAAWGGCGINGGDCQPFESQQWSAVRCPHRCTLLDTERRVVGGRGGIYKADSRVCAAAIHAGVVDDSSGGCFFYRPAGMRHFFQSGGTHAGITSVGFPSWFPGSIAFAPAEGAHMCSNFGVAILIVGLVWLLPLTLMRPNALFLWLLLLCWGYWYAAMTLNDRFTQRALFWRGTVDMWIIFVFGYVLYFIAPRHALFVDTEYERRAANEWPWKLCCNQRVRRWVSALTRRGPHGRRVQSHVGHARPSPDGGHSSTGGNSMSAPISSSSSSRGSAVYLRVAAPSANNQRHGLGIAVPPPTSAAAAAGAAGPGSTDSQGSVQMAPSPNLSAPLICASPSAGDWAGATPSPSPSPLDSPSATSALYNPPHYDVRRRIGSAGSGEVTVDDRGAHYSVAVALSMTATASPEPSPEPSPELSPSPEPSSVPPLIGVTCAPPGRVLRPWYELYLFFVLPMVAAFHFTYVAYIAVDIDLDSSFFSHGASGFVLIAVVLVVVAGVVLHAMRMAQRINVLARYLLYYIYVGLVVMVVSLLFASSASFHLHHVLAGLLLLPMSRFPSRVSLVFQAVAAGIFVNGLAIWGFEAAWDVAHAPQGGVHWKAANNPPPAVIQVTNSTRDSVFIAWPLPNEHVADGIGSSLSLNGVEIYHSTWVDTTYGGGGFTPRNMTTSATQQTTTRSARTMKRRDQIREAVATAAAASDEDERSTELHAEAAHLLRSMAAFGQQADNVYIELHQPDRAPAELALPHIDSGGTNSRRSRGARALTVVKPLEPRPWRLWTSEQATDDDAVDEHAEEAEALYSSALPWPTAQSSSSPSNPQSQPRSISPLSSPTPPLAVGGKYQLFQLVGLHPNSSYIVQAAHIQPGGWLLPGEPHIFRTRAR